MHNAFRLTALVGLFAVALMFSGCACPCAADDDATAAVCSPPADACSTTMVDLGE
jgi:hypothetical protein